MREPDFELSADMRLLELQRGALGLPPRERLSWESRTGAEGSLPIPEEPEPVGQSAVLSVEVAANPSDGVIPGAVITFSLSVANVGSATATEIVAGASLPGGSTYRPGTFVWNGRSTYDDVAESFFENGLPIGALSAGERATFQWKVGVRLGNKPLIVAPAVRSSGAGIVGASPVAVSRKAQAGSNAFADDLQRAEDTIVEPRALIPVHIPVTDLPIYELDEEEQIAYEAADAALSSAAPKIVEPEPAPAPTEELQPAPTPPEEPQPAVTVQAAEPRNAVVLYGRFDRTTVSFFERSFGGTKPATILQHCIFGGALACSLDAAGEDPASLKAHLDAQSQVLHRIVLHEKLGKKEPIAGYAGELLAKVELLEPRPAVDVAADSKTSLCLSTELSEPTLAVLLRISEERERFDFIKARQLTLALQAQTIVGDVDETLRQQIEGTLRAYAQTSVTILQRLFVRIRIDRTTGLLLQNEPTLDAAARAVIAAFKLVLT
jgi:uncharacterized repeat protein (TIGR01451 family)